MNSYPVELTHHVYASMFVAGLVKAGGAGGSNSAGSGGVTPSAAGQGSSPAVNGSSSSSTSSAAASHPCERYPDLCRQLAEILLARGKNTVWDPARGRSAVFHSTLVDHNARLPPRKTRPSSRSVAAVSPSAQGDTSTAAAESLASLPPRSPLSPLHPASPLFPDGLVAPIWVRKHRDIVPSVFVAFHCLAESYVIEEQQSDEAGEEAAADGQPSEPSQPRRRPLTGPELKVRDEELVRLIAERKRSLAERGIKMTVVILTNRDMLENPQLEARLSFIRRSSGLDSRASLFVLTPISRAELGDFVTSLQGALYEHALDYYREGARRVRRKRTRYPPPPSVVQPILQSVTASRPGTKASDLVPLSREGWHVRAEFKLAMFAEWHGDYEMALSHYREAYDLLAGPRGMLGNTMLLPPRTKRWAEAKVLSDALSIRIARLHLYADDGTSALAQFKNHVARFVELSSGWGIGDATFEFWSWLAKQYRLMGDLLLEAVRDIQGSPLPPFQLPLHISQLPSFLLHPHIADNAQNYPSLRAAPGALLSPNNAAMASGIAPAGQLQGPGAFYYLAALCTQERRERFNAMIAQEEKGQLAQSGAAALVHEKKVDHCANIVEALERARDVFQSSHADRTASFITAKIASTHAMQGHYEVALPLLMRLVKAYIDEEWNDATRMLLFQALDCAEKTQNTTATVHLLLEAIALGEKLSSSDRGIVNKKWAALSASTESSLAAANVAFQADRGPLRADIVFKDASIPLATTAALQVTIRSADAASDADSPPLDLAFDEMTWLDASGEQIAHVAHAEDGESTAAAVVDLGSLHDAHAEKASLRWTTGDVRTFAATITANDRHPISISQVVLSTTKAGLPLTVTLQVKPPPAMSLPTAPLWRTSNGRVPWVQLPYREDASRVKIDRPVHNVDVSVEHHEAAFVDETVTVAVKVRNNDSCPLKATLDVVLHPAFPGSQDELASDTLRQQPTLSGRLPGLHVGNVAPGEEASTTFTLKCKHRPRPRSLRLSVHTAVADQARSEEHDHDDPEHAGETIRDVSLPVTRAFRAEYSAHWSPVQQQQQRQVGASASLSTAGFDDAAALTGHPRSPSARPATSSGWPDPQDPSASSSAAIAHLHAAFAVLTAGVSLNLLDVQIEMEKEFAADAKVLEGGGPDVATARRESLEGEWSERDRWSHTWQVEVALKEYYGIDGDQQQQRVPRVQGPTGHLVIHWKRSDAAHDVPPSITRLTLPIFAPPHLNARVLVASPPVTHLHQAFTLVFVVVNPSSSPVDVIVYLDDDPAWQIGHRTLSIPGIPARGSRSVPTRLVPRAQGTWTLPRARAFHQRARDEGEAAASAAMPLLNETPYGLPLHVRFRASAGATMGAAASKAISSGQIPAEQEGPSLSVLVLNREDAS